MVKVVFVFAFATLVCSQQNCENCKDKAEFFCTLPATLTACNGTDFTSGLIQLECLKSCELCTPCEDISPRSCLPGSYSCENDIPTVRCEFFKRLRMCEEGNLSYFVKKKCKETCDLCVPEACRNSISPRQLEPEEPGCSPTCGDEFRACRALAQQQLCLFNKDVRERCQASCGECIPCNASSTTDEEATINERPSQNTRASSTMAEVTTSRRTTMSTTARTNTPASTTTSTPASTTTSTPASTATSTPASTTTSTTASTTTSTPASTTTSTTASTTTSTTASTTTSTTASTTTSTTASTTTSTTASTTTSTPASTTASTTSSTTESTAITKSDPETDISPMQPSSPAVARDCSRDYAGKNAGTIEEQCLNAHNFYRCLHGADDLEYDESLAESASDYLDQLITLNSEVSENGVYDLLPSQPGVDRIVNVGENLAVEMPLYDNYTIGDAVADWYAERLKFDFDNKAITPKTSYFTQLIWGSTTRVGCGLRKKGDVTFAAAHYHVEGNDFSTLDNEVSAPTADVCLVDCGNGTCQSLGIDTCQCSRAVSRGEIPSCRGFCVVTCPRPKDFVGNWRESCEGSQMCICHDTGRAEFKFAPGAICR